MYERVSECSFATPTLTIQEVPFFESCVPQKCVQHHLEPTSHKCTQISTLDNHI
jgi:hypothetical protein